MTSPPDMKRVVQNVTYECRDPETGHHIETVSVQVGSYEDTRIGLAILEGGSWWRRVDDTEAQAKAEIVALLPPGVDPAVLDEIATRVVAKLREPAEDPASVDDPPPADPAPERPADPVPGDEQPADGHEDGDER